MDEKKPAQRDAEYERIRAYLADVRAARSHRWPIDDEMLLIMIGPNAWAHCVNHELIASGKDALPPDEARLLRAKLFD